MTVCKNACIQNVRPKHRLWSSISWYSSGCRRLNIVSRDISDKMSLTASLPKNKLGISIYSSASHKTALRICPPNAAPALLVIEGTGHFVL